LAKILIVEDVELNRDLLVQLLEEEHEVITAVDGPSCLAILERDVPDIILMDISLPGIDGLVIAQQIKNNSRLKAIPIIAVTAHAMRGDKEKVLASGCDAYLSKPLDEPELFDLIDAFLKRP
jgi:CheY-like chemotaxis protein